MHYIGSSLVLALLGFMVFSGQWQWWWALLIADWVMYKDRLTGQLAEKLAKWPASGGQ